MSPNVLHSNMSVTAHKNFQTEMANPAIKQSAFDRYNYFVLIVRARLLVTFPLLNDETFISI